MNKKNPFAEYYRAELVDGEHFVSLFSPVIINRVSELFKTGNVVLKGTPGIGKTMLLSLYKPEVRIAYFKKNEKFPISKDLSKFIATGININTSGAWSFDQRSDDDPDNKRKAPFYFSDFVNYWLVSDLLKNIELYVDAGENVCKTIGINVANFSKHKFLAELIGNECWFGALSEAGNYRDLKNLLGSRLTAYKQYLNFNLQKIPPEIDKTKTEIGKPLTALINSLKTSGCLSKNTNIFVHIDQYEDLFHIEENDNKQFREMLNKGLADRNSDASYRISTRSYAWNDEKLTIFGSSATLENGRTHYLLDLDSVLRREENSSSWVFPDLIEKVFVRRLKNSGCSIDEKMSHKEVLKSVFGKSLTPDKKAKIYGGKNRERALLIDTGWPNKWIEFLKKLNLESVLQAKYAESWVRQRAKDKKEFISSFSKTGKYPWDQKPYWKKERKSQALKQISGRCGQKEIWSGYEDIINLSGSNVSTFLLICKYIWSEWLEEGIELNNAPDISYEKQNIGIHKASSYYFQKISSEYNGENRTTFITACTRELEKILYNDISMSNPGYTGFSLRNDELKKSELLKKLVDDLVGFGDLRAAPHTTKTNDRHPRTKYYPRPMLCPTVKLPLSQTKEPFYATIKNIGEWAQDVKLGTQSPDRDDLQTEFDF